MTFNEVVYIDALLSWDDLISSIVSVPRKVVFDVRALVPASRELLYDVRECVGATETLVHDNRAPVAAVERFNHLLTVFIGADIKAKYGIGGVVQAPWTLRYDVRECVSAVETLIHNNWVFVAATERFSSLLTAFTGREGKFNYPIRLNSGSPVATFRYSVRVLAGLPVVFLHNIDGHIIRAITFDSTILNWTGRDGVFRYNTARPDGIIGGHYHAYGGVLGEVYEL